VAGVCGLWWRSFPVVHVWCINGYSDEGLARSTADGLTALCGS